MALLVEQVVKSGIVEWNYYSGTSSAKWDSGVALLVEKYSDIWSIFPPNIHKYVIYNSNLYEKYFTPNYLCNHVL